MKTDGEIATLSMQEKFNRLKCCGNCKWNTDALIHDKCDPSNWMTYSGKDRGRGICNNWEERVR